MKTSDGARATTIAAAVLVACSVASEPMAAPVATFTSTHLRAKPELQFIVEQTQGTIRNLFAAGRDGEAQALHDRMCADMMDVVSVDVSRNVVTTVGKNDLLDKYFAGSAYTAAWFCGLISSVSYTAVAAADTMASHGGWTEAGATNAPTYTGNRPALSWATAASAGSKTTSAASSFTFTGTGTIKGMFANTVTTKDGTTGTLYNAVLFTGGDRAVVNTDVVNVSVTFTIT